MAVKAAGLPVGPNTQAVFDTAIDIIKSIAPGSVELLSSALKFDAKTRAAFNGPAVGPTGLRRGEALAAGMERERKAVLDPLVRAGRFVEQLDLTMKRIDKAETGTDRGTIVAAKSAAEAVVRKLANDKAAQAVLADHPAARSLDPARGLSQALRKPDIVKALTEVIEPPVIARSYGFSY
jgi:hypothetical protein